GAAGGGDRPRARGEPARAAARRAVPRPRPGCRPADVPAPAGPARGRRHGPRRGAGREPGGPGRLPGAVPSRRAYHPRRPAGRFHAGPVGGGVLRVAGCSGMSWVNAVVQGVLLGGLYALFACGLSLLFGVMRVINLAHGDLAVLAAYLAVLAVPATGLPLAWSFAVVVPVFAVVGFLL